jgi:hypothetical protein
MPFINEYISAEDIKKYDIEALDKRFHKGHYKPSWTVDHERDMYLRYMTKEHEEFSHHITYCFYWKGVVIEVLIELSEAGGARNGPQWSRKKLLRWNLPANLVAQETEIKADLKEAFIAYKDFGILSTSTTYTVTFDF